MFYFYIPALLIGCIPMIICDSNCVYKVDDGLTLDIRTLGFTDGKGPKYNHISNAATTPNTFSWNGCFPYSTNDQGNCSDAAACYCKSSAILVTRMKLSSFQLMQRRINQFSSLNKIQLNLNIIKVHSFSPINLHMDI